MRSRIWLAPAAALVLALGVSACGSSDSSGGGGGGGSSSSSINGAGSTFAAPIYQQWGNALKDQGITVNYQPVGSGAGIAQLAAGTADFGASDPALTPEDRATFKKGEAVQIPMAFGAITVAYNLDGVDKGLKLDGATTADIFLGKITKWDDPAIAKLNSGVKLPSTGIKVFFRSDESGTTENFEKYLAGAAPSAWTAEPTKKWAGTVGEGREKSAGVSDGVKSTDGGITYVEWSYARDNALGVAQIDNGGGAVELTGDSAGKALTAAKPAGEGNDLKLALDYTTKAPGTYPIVLVTYEVVCSKGLDATKTAVEKAFLGHYASAEVQQGLLDIGYAPLPEEVRTKVETAVKAIS